MSSEELFNGQGWNVFVDEERLPDGRIKKEKDIAEGAQRECIRTAALFEGESLLIDAWDSGD